jgi:hypothetical protein
VIWREGYSYKKAGVLLLDLYPAATMQDGLFHNKDDARRVTLMRTIDRLNLPMAGTRSVLPLPAAMDDAARPAFALLHDGME